MKFFEAIQKYEAWKSFSIKTKTLSKHHYSLRMFCLFLKNPQIEEIGLDDVLSYLGLMRELGWDQNSFIQKVTAIKKCFKFFKDQGYKVLNYELIPVISYEHKLAKVMDEETHNKLLASLKTNYPDDLRNRLILMMLWDTGARNGEVCSLNIEDLNLVEKKAVIRTEKNKGTRPFREVMWTEKTNEVLKRWLKDKEPTGPLFISLAYNHNGGRLTSHTLSTIVRRICDKAGIPRINPHSYRHHMAHDVLNKGFSVIHVAKVLGHSNPKSSFSYLHINDKELRETYRKVKGD